MNTVPPLHILCVDDDRDVLEVVRLTLETVGGYKTTCFSSGKEAIMKAADCQPDLILLDVMMPDIDGLTTLRKLRTETPLKDVPIVFMSARIQAAEVRGYLRDGATAVIEKPFNPMTLPDHIAEIWQKWQERN